MRFVLKNAERALRDSIFTREELSFVFMSKGNSHENKYIVTVQEFGHGDTENRTANGR